MRTQCSIVIFVAVLEALICTFTHAHVLDEPKSNLKDFNPSGHVDSSTPTELIRLRRGEPRASLSRREFNPKSSESRVNDLNRRSEYFIGDPSEISKVIPGVNNLLSPRSEEESLEHRLTYIIPSDTTKDIPITGILPPHLSKATQILGKDSPGSDLISKVKARRMVYGWINPGYDGAGLAVINDPTRTIFKNSKNT